MLCGVCDLLWMLGCLIVLFPDCEDDLCSNVVLVVHHLLHNDAKALSITVMNMMTIIMIMTRLFIMPLWIENQICTK